MSFYVIFMSFYVSSLTNSQGLPIGSTHYQLGLPIGSTQFSLHSQPIGSTHYSQLGLPIGSTQFSARTPYWFHTILT